MLIKRRDILGGMSGLAMAPIFAESLRAAGPEAANNLIVVAILLNGGNDGLNTVIPLSQYAYYLKLRTPATPPTGLNMAYALTDLEELAFDSTTSTPPLSASTYAFAPSMIAMRNLYATGKLAVINGIGLPPQELNPLSHYNAQLDWLTGTINFGSPLPNGWLGQALSGTRGGALGATISLGGTTQVLIEGTHQGVVINPPMDYFNIAYGNSDNQGLLEKTFASVAAQATGSASAAAEQSVLKAALGDIADVATIAKAQKAKTYPLNNWLDYQLRDISRLIAGGAGAHAYFAQLGGFDTHSSQALTQPALLQQLGESLVNFYLALTAANAAKNVVVMTMSDFGRRPAANLDFGTDHGGASTSFVFGDPVTGGCYGTYPSLKQFDANDNLKYNVDFRNVMSDLIQAMGVNPTPILGQTYPKLGFI